LNRVIAFVNENGRSIRFSKLEASSLRIVGISDASFAGNIDCTSHLGYLVFLADANDNAIPIYSNPTMLEE